MNSKIERDKNNFNFQDINSINKKNFKIKIFKFFYSLFLEKREIKSLLKLIIIFLETLQFIAFAFSPNHFDSWKVEKKSIKLISDILNSFNLSTFIKLLKYEHYIAILYIIVIIIFILNLIVAVNIIFVESFSKFYYYSKIIIRSLIDVIAVLLFIPITNLLLMEIKCINGKVYGFEDGEKCWKKLYFLNFSLSIIGTGLLFIWCIFIINFSFYSFTNNASTIRTNSKNDIIILFFKLFLVLQSLLISNEYLSSIILILISLFMFYFCYNERTYNNNAIEIAINIRNLLVCWTYLVLLISKIFIKLTENGFIYLFVFGSPIIIYISIAIFQEKDFSNIQVFRNCKNLKAYIRKIEFNIKLYNSFIEKFQNIGNIKENERNKFIIILKGNIKIHNLVCSEKDCPLTKFENNEGNFSIQKQCLLNYINSCFIIGLKAFPNNIYLLMQYINFNYNAKFNLNSVRINLLKLKKLKCNIKEEYIIYCLEQNIKNMKHNGMEVNVDQNNDFHVDLIGQKYQKLKYCIENSLKLFGEFWGIFSTNISSNINTTKLYSIGEKLNIYLNEMKNT